MSAPATHSLEAERAILGAMMLSGSACDEAAEVLHARHFHLDRHRRLFVAMLTLRASQTAVDILTLADHLTRAGEMELVGGPAVIASLMEAATTTANLAHHAGIVRRLWQQRETARLATLIAENAGEPETVRQAISELSELDGAESAADQRWALAAVHGDALLRKEFPAHDPIIGDGFGKSVLPVGGLGYMIGDSGAGKTYLAIQIAQGVASGSPVLDLPTRQARVGILEMEMTEDAIQDRLKEFDSEGAADDSWLSRISVLCYPPGSTLITEPDVAKRLETFIRQHELGLLIVDPLNRLHESDENDAREVGRVLAAIHKVRIATGCAFLLLHHVNKPQEIQQKQRVRTDYLRRARGSGRWMNDADAVMYLDEQKGRHLLMHTKVRLGKEPENKWLKRTDAGYFVLTSNPDECISSNRLQFEELMHHASAGITTKEVVEATGLHRVTVVRKLKGMGAQLRGAKNDPNARWFMPDGNQQSVDEGWQ